LLSRASYFRTRSDTEFILLAYEAWGLDCIAKLRAWFAIVIVDLRRQKVLLIRDRMGIKPLVYYHTRRELASPLRCAACPFVPELRARFSEESIDAYSAHRYIPAPRTAFSHMPGWRRPLPELRSHHRNRNTAIGTLGAEPGDWLAPWITRSGSHRLRTGRGAVFERGHDSSVIRER